MTSTELDAVPAPTPERGRVQLALNVDNLDRAVAFYTALFGTPPAKVRPGYANFAVAAPPLKLVLLENPGRGGTLNHLGVEVSDSDRVHDEFGRLASAGLFPEEEIGTTCCFATQDKVWATGPDRERWEIYTVLADSASFGVGASADGDNAEVDAGGCCGSARSCDRTADPVATGAASPCC
ncbi:MAG: ArsI/CadI family heavy metal resistance metalloenzyme [Mycobacteriales bacterium]